MFKHMRLLILYVILCCISVVARADSRLKDLVYFEGIRENMLVGYGLVVGLNGTGDNLKNSVFTEKGLIDFLGRLGVNARGTNLKTKNIAAVMVTASLPAFARAGNKVNVNVSTLGDAKSLKGGTLVATPLLGADGEVYAVAQGPVTIGALAEDVYNKFTPIPTAGYVGGGGIVEREIAFTLNNVRDMRLALKNPDITTARAIAVAINSYLQDQFVATAQDPGTVAVNIPSSYKNNAVGFLADIEGLTIIPDTVAKIVIDEATGTIVINENVKISAVAIAQGNLVLKVSEEKTFLKDLIDSMKPKNKQKREEKSEPGTQFALLKETATLADLVEGLNALKVKTQDMVAILKTVQQAGALQAEIQVR